MVLIIFVLIPCLFFSFNSKYNEKEINFFNSNNSTIDNCLELKNFDFKDFIICSLNVTKENPDYTKNYLENNSALFIEFFNLYIVSTGKTFLSPLLNLTKDIFLNKSNKLLNETFELIKNPNSSIIIDYIIQIINNRDEIFSILKNIFNVQGVKELLNYTFERYENKIIDIIEVILTNTESIQLFHMVKEYLSNNLDTLFELLYEIIQNSNDRKGIANTFKHFFINNTHNIEKSLKETHVIFLNKTIIEEFLKVVSFGNKGLQNIIEEIFLNENLVNFTFNLVYNKTYVEALLDIIINLDDKNFLNKKIPMFADFLRDNQKKNLNFFLDITETIGKNLVHKKQFNEFVAMKLGKKIKELIFENNTIFNSINSKCMNLFEKQFLMMIMMINLMKKI